MAVELNRTPNMHQFQSVQKAMSLPTVEAAVGQVGALYGRVKAAHSLLEWALSSAEAGVCVAAASAAPLLAGPLAGPLAGADARAAAALAALERRVPLLAAPPADIVDATRHALLTTVTPHVNKVSPQVSRRVSSLRELSWARANALLSTASGRRALQGLDAGAARALDLLDHYLPAPAAGETRSEESAAGAEATEEQPAQRAARTVARLSAEAARRLWAALHHKLYQLRKSGVELDVRGYIAALLAAVQLTALTGLSAVESVRGSVTASPAAAAAPTAADTAPPPVSAAATPAPPPATTTVAAVTPAPAPHASTPPAPTPQKALSPECDSEVTE